MSEGVDVLSDWAEASCVFDPQGFVSRSEVASALDNSGIPNVDDVVGSIWLEISRRHSLAQMTHPVVCRQDGLEKALGDDAFRAYAFQLLLSLASYYPSMRMDAKTRRKVTKLFERVTASALTGYLRMCSVEITGFPREDSVPRPFRQCLDYLARKLHEKRGSTQVFSSNTKDEGVDVVAWQPFNDKRPSQLILLAQCATGRNWRGKTSQIMPDVWRNYVNWLAGPAKAFAFPFVGMPDEWDRLSFQAGILLDRLRISSMLAASGRNSRVRREIKDSITWLSRSLRPLQQ